VPGRHPGKWQSLKGPILNFPATGSKVVCIGGEDCLSHLPRPWAKCVNGLSKTQHDGQLTHNVSALGLHELRIYFRRNDARVNGLRAAFDVRQHYPEKSAYPLLKRSDSSLRDVHEKRQNTSCPISE
jgi:hypothetical protein